MTSGEKEIIEADEFWKRTVYMQMY